MSWGCGLREGFCPSLRGGWPCPRPDSELPAWGLRENTFLLLQAPGRWQPGKLTHYVSAPTSSSFLLPLMDPQRLGADRGHGLQQN